ncbi:hypothetical protein B296_00003685 [Ensete ventricosum]|uniref:Uncharacterized protein n=1 Tax=Ensete ventricosum TaxID=4639 RepID=A0A426YLW8_ENSVE|nr:hypothetical protein B296_00003685 [Ensete ventricosum]
MVKLVFRDRDFDSVSKSPERFLGGEDQEFHFSLDYSRRYSYLSRGVRWYECLMGLVFSAAPGYDPAPSDAFADSQDKVAVEPQAVHEDERRSSEICRSWTAGCPFRHGWHGGCSNHLTSVDQNFDFSVLSN